MSASIEARLKDLGITLPQAAAPAANYVPYVISGSHLYISGQLPMENGKIAVTGHLGDGVADRHMASSDHIPYGVSGIHVGREHHRPRERR